MGRLSVLDRLSTCGHCIHAHGRWRGIAGSASDRAVPAALTFVRLDRPPAMRLLAMQPPHQVVQFRPVWSIGASLPDQSSREGGARHGQQLLLAADTQPTSRPPLATALSSVSIAMMMSWIGQRQLSDPVDGSQALRGRSPHPPRGGGERARPIIFIGAPTKLFCA